MSVEYNGKEYRMKERGGMLSLNLSGKGIKDITEIKGLKLLTDLQALKLSNNIIAEIKGLDTLKSLVMLDFSYNRIAKINGLESLTNLEDLNLGYNKIETIEGLDNLGKLSRLNFLGNNISHVESSKNKDNLKYFNLGKSNLLYVRVEDTFGSVTGQNVFQYAQISEAERRAMYHKTWEIRLRKDREQREEMKNKRIKPSISIFDKCECCYCLIFTIVIIFILLATII